MNMRPASLLSTATASAVAAVVVSVALSGGDAAGADREATVWTNQPKGKKSVPLSLADLAERARPAVVHVRGTTEGGGEGEPAGAEGSRTSIGTGFLIHKDGYLVTNEHVIRSVTDLRIRLYDGRELPACVVGADAPTDIALIKIDAAGPLPVIPLGDSDAVRVGETVVAIGNPYGFNHSVTAGIISAKERVVDRSTLHETPQQDIYSFFIQTDASINLGNSGGPLIDANGAVIGVNAAFWAGHPLQPAQGIGFAIPINMAKSLLPRLREKGDAPRSFLGIDAQPVDAALAVALKLETTRGALVASVEKKSPAEAGGLEPGDVVVTWNGTPVATSEDLKIDAQLTLPGSRIKVGLLRDGKRVEREVTTRAAAGRTPPPSHPASCSRKRAAAADAPDDFEVTEVPAVRAANLPGGRGILVSQLSGHGAAAQAGLKVGDVILRVGKEGVRTRRDLTATLKTFKAGDTIPMLVRRGGYDFWTAFTRR
jgi:serine protease Do